MNVYDMRPEKLVQGLIDLVEYISNKKSKDLVMIEVGSYAGQSMEIFASTNKIKTIILEQHVFAVYLNQV